MNRKLLSLLSLCILLCTAQLSHAEDEGILVDSGGHPILKPARLQPESPRLDVEEHKPLQGKVADWSLYDLGIEYDEKLLPPPPKVLIKKVRLGTWAARAGLESGDLILKVEIKPDAYLITIDRKDKTYRATLSKLDSTKLATNTTAATAQSDATQAELKTGIEKPHHGSGIMTHIEYGDKITTEINLALCMPEPTDNDGKGQWDLLSKERSAPPLNQSWNDWLTALRVSTNNNWPPRISGYGRCDLHVVMRNGQVVDVSLLHNMPSDEFSEQALTYARTLRAPFPRDSQVTEIHLEVKFRREVAVSK